MEGTVRPGSRLVCLLPIRNAEEDLPGYLESVARFADAVVALDDGSSDRTRELLEAEPLVELLLANPRRRSYSGWDDAANRNRLLEAAAELQPDWIVSLDADDRVDADDAAALRGFLERDALPGCAFGFRYFRMWGQDRYDPRITWAYRLFAYAPRQRFPDRERLHFDPVPTSIPRQAWLRTTLRIRHLAAMNEERRLARLAKYREADPEGEYPTNLGWLAERPEGELPRWEPRPAGLPVLTRS